MNAKVEAEVNAGQLVMFTPAAMQTLDPTIGKVFGQTTKERIGKDGQVLSTTRVSMVKRSEIAKSLDLVGKANKGALDAKVMEVRDILMRGAKGQIATYEDDVTFHSARVSQMASGNERIVWTFERINRAKTTVELETMAKALGCTVKELMTKLEELAAAKAAEMAKKANVSPPAELEAPKEAAVA